MRTRQSEDREVEVPRADLIAILVDAGREAAWPGTSRRIERPPGHCNEAYGSPPTR
jgi:hypothetical protein